MQVYFEAEKYLKTSKGSLQHRIFNDKHLKSSGKHIYALVISTLKFKEYIAKVIKASEIKKSPVIKKLKVSDDLLLLLVHDLLFQTKGRIQLGRHPIKEAILQHKTRLNSELIKLKLKYKVKSLNDLPNLKGGAEDETPIRWFRANQIKLTTPELFQKYLFFQNLQPVDSISQIQEPGVIYHDQYIPNLFGVSTKERIMNTDAYKRGEIIIQDRASCFPSHILFSDPLFVPTLVIDACAAPGNKTTHIASYLAQNELDHSVVFAFERDSKRVETLKTMCKVASGNSNLIHITHADFTTVDPNDFKQVDGIVVDPSCSGSGIFGRAIEDSVEQEKEDINVDRLNRLSGFQFKIMKHALLFPNASKVVYSTCSIHAEENERVVVDLLMDEDIKRSGWSLAPRDLVIPTWERRGWPQEFTALQSKTSSLEELAGGCVRAIPTEDGGIGFFAACFIKSPISPSESNNDDDEEWTGFSP